MARNWSISEKRVLQVLRDRDRERKPVLAAKDVAERTDVSRPTAKDRLDALVEEGVLKTHTYGRVMVYWPADERMTNDPDPISGGVAEDVEAIAQANGEPREATLRRLVQLGIEAEGRDARPSELQAEVNQLKSDRDRVEEDLADTEAARDRANEYALAGAIVTLGLLLSGLALSIPQTLLSALPFGLNVISGVQTLAAIIILVGIVAWFVPIVRYNTPDILE